MSKKFVYTEKELPQRSSEWIEMRKTCVGGSDVATILGLMDKYSKAETLWKRETGRIAPKEENDAMMRGVLMEDDAKSAVIEHLKEVEGIKSPKLPMLFAKHPEYDFIGVSFDGVDLKNKYIVELKCPKFSSVFKSVFLNGIQDYYYPQVQLQLGVANAHWGITKAYFCSFYPDGAYILDVLNFIERFKTLAVIDIDYDPDYFNEMVKVIRIYRDFIESDKFDKKLLKEAVAEFNDYTRSNDGK